METLALTTLFQELVDSSCPIVVLVVVPGKKAHQNNCAAGKVQRTTAELIELFSTVFSRVFSVSKPAHVVAADDEAGQICLPVDVLVALQVTTALGYLHPTANDVCNVRLMTKS